MSDPFLGERPTAAAIDQLYAHLEPLWSAVRSKMSEDDTYHNGTFPVWRDLLDKRATYHPPKSRYLIDNAVDRQISVEPKFTKFPAGQGAAHDDAADAAEEGLLAVWRDSSMREVYIPARQAYRHLIQYGYTVLGMQLDMEGKPKEPKRKDSESDEEWKERQDAYEVERASWNYIRIKAPHPSRVLMNPLERQPDCAIITAQRYSGDLYALVKAKGRYGNRNVSSYAVDANPYRLVDTLEVWTPNWHALKLKSGEVLFTEKNDLGFQPWGHTFAGWGGEETNMGENDQNLAAKLAVSMLEGSKELLRVQAQKASALHNSVLERGYARMIAQRPEEVAQALGAGPTAVMPGEKGEIDFLEFPDVRDWVIRSMENDDQELQRATLALDQSGERQTGVTTVGQQMLLQENSDQKFYIPNKQIEWLTSITASNICRAVHMVGESITLRGKKLAKKDIGGSFEVMAEYKRVNVVLQLEQNRQNKEMADSGYISAKTLRERSGMENEAEEVDRLLDSEMAKDPRVHEEIYAQHLIKRGMKELGEHLLEQIKIQRMQAEAQARAGVTGAATAPLNGQQPAAAMPAALGAM